MTNQSTLAAQFVKELEAEAASTRKCLERISESTFAWKPHEKSMPMGYLALLVAEIPRWIEQMVEKSEIDLGTFQHFQPKTTAELVKHFDENLKAAKNAIQNASDESFENDFQLKNKEIFFFVLKEDRDSVCDQSSGSSSRTTNRLHAAQQYSRPFDLRTFGR